jgi:hypothetical protein
VIGVGHRRHEFAGGGALLRFLELLVEVAEIEQEEQIEELLAVAQHERVARRDAFAAEVALEQDRLERHVLAAGDFAQARAGDPPSELVVVARAVARWTRRDAHEAPSELDEARIAIALADDPLGSGFAVHVDGDQERPPFALRARLRVLQIPLPRDLRARRGSGGRSGILGERQRGEQGEERGHGSA